MTLQLFISATILALLFCSLNAFSGQSTAGFDINAPYPQTLPPQVEYHWQQLDWQQFCEQQQSGFYWQQHGKNMEIHPTHNPVMTRLALNNGPTSHQLTLAQAQANQQANLLGLQDLCRCFILKQIEEGLARLTINTPPTSTDENSNGISREDSHAFKFDKIDIESTDPNEKPAAVFIASDREGNTIAFAGPRDPAGHELAELLKEHCKSFPQFDINQDTFKRISCNRITPKQIHHLSDARKIINLDHLMLEIHKKHPDSYHVLSH
jgi:hypothetical protein